MVNRKEASELPFYLFISGIFLLIISPNLLSRGMFMDGLMYASISKNLSEGVGTLWNLQFTKFCHPEFHEHPPLAFWLQAALFFVCGDIVFLEKLYSIFTLILTGWLIVLSWQKMGFRHGWLPLLFWLSVPLVNWTATNNMLENTMMVFVMLAVYLLINSWGGNRNRNLLLAGLMLALGFLTKGFVAFFPWAFPFALWLARKKVSFLNMVTETIWLIFATLVPFAVLFWLVPEAWISIEKYLHAQVVNSLKNVVTVDNRFFIVSRLMQEQIPAMIIFLLFFLAGRRRSFATTEIRENSSLALGFLLAGLAGVLPIMVSMKQSGYYMLAAFPLLAMAMALVIYPFVDKLISNVDAGGRAFRMFRNTALCIFVLGLIIPVLLKDRISRDRETILDVLTILPFLEKGSTIQLEPAIINEWSLLGYFSRNKNISLNPDLSRRLPFLLARKEMPLDSLASWYEIVPLETRRYNLYKRRQSN